MIFPNFQHKELTDCDELTQQPSTHFLTGLLASKCEHPGPTDGSLWEENHFHHNTEANDLLWLMAPPAGGHLRRKQRRLFGSSQWMWHQPGIPIKSAASPPEIPMNSGNWWQVVEGLTAPHMESSPHGAKDHVQESTRSKLLLVSRLKPDLTQYCFPSLHLHGFGMVFMDVSRGTLMNSERENPRNSLHIEEASSTCCHFAIKLIWKLESAVGALGRFQDCMTSSYQGVLEKTGNYNWPLVLVGWFSVSPMTTQWLAGGVTTSTGRHRLQFLCELRESANNSLTLS